MAASGDSGLSAADPRVGQTLSVEGRAWEVTDHSSYWDDEGYRVVEWCCESDGAEAYLLKEIREGAPTRWFFTRQVPRARVPGLPSGGDAAPPPTLTYEGQAYRYAESTEGTYEDEPGERVQKTTWEYWDEGRQHNLAIEVWADGRMDCYHGAYIEPGQVTLESGAAESRPSPAAAGAGLGAAKAMVGKAMAAKGGTTAATGGNPFVAAAFTLPFAYVLPFFFGRPFDQSLTVAVSLALIVGWGLSVKSAPGAGWIGLLGVLAVGWVFATYAPLGNPVGLATLLGAPAVIGLWGRKHGARGRRAVVYVAALVVGLPAFAIGLYYYFNYAPGPHSLSQLILALGPATLGAVAAMVIARLVLSGMESSAA